MKKLTLDLDALQVESFDTTDGRDTPGTVVANQAARSWTDPANYMEKQICPTYWTCGVSCLGTCGFSCYTCFQPTCNSCVPTCGATCPVSCWGTCEATCAHTCALSCQGTCEITCQWRCNETWGATCGGPCDFE